MPSYYEIDFSNGTTLKYQLEDNPVANAFKEFSEALFKFEDTKVWPYQSPAPMWDEEYLHMIWDRMYENVQLWNSGKVWKDAWHIEMPKILDIKQEGLRDLLNYLHYEFHRFEENYSESDSLLYDPLQQLNADIHTVEHLLYIAGRIQDNETHIPRKISRLSFFNYTQKKLEYPKLTEEMFEHFDNCLVNGAIFLGYHTVGKNLQHCSLDNDIALVKKGMIRPQQTVSNEVCIMFFRGEENPNFVENQKNHIIQWVTDNNLQEYVDLNDKRNLLVGHPLLGRLVNPMTAEEGDTLLKTATILRARITSE